MRKTRAATAAAGRLCPHDYSYDPATFDRPAEISTEVMDVGGGLYGNVKTLDALDAPVTAEHSMRWPEESAAHRSYLGRITSGPGHALARATVPAPASAA